MRRTIQELKELRDPRHPRQEMSPMGELGMADLAVEGQRIDEDRCVGLCDLGHDDGNHEGTGTPRGHAGPDPIDSDVESIDWGDGLLRALEHPDVDL